MAVMVSDSKGKLSSSFKDAGESSSKRMARSSFPPGFRFHPTDVELIQYYLKRKVMKKKLNYKVISEIQLYNFAPWDLPEKSCLQTGDLEWYFFCPRDKKYGSGSRTNRATDIGYWKTTGKDRSIQYSSRTVGVKKTLIFHVGKSPHGSRTDWVMHEYMLKDKKLADASVVQDTYVLCKLFEKSGSGPKNGEQHGAPFVEEEWEDDPSIEMMDSLSSAQLAEQLTFADPSENAAHGSMSHQLPDHIETFLSNLLHDDESGPAHLQGGTCEDFCPPINERMPAHDGSDLFLHIGDLSYQEPLQLDGFDADRMLEELLLGISGEPQMEVIRSYMEPSDLVSPMEGNDYMYVPPANIGSHPFAVGPNENEDVAAFPLDHGATTAYVNDEFGGSSGWQYEAESLSSSVFQNPEQQILWPLHLAECSLNNPSTVTPGFSSSVPT